MTVSQDAAGRWFGGPLTVAAAPAVPQPPLAATVILLGILWIGLGFLSRPQRVGALRHGRYRRRHVNMPAGSAPRAAARPLPAAAGAPAASTAMVSVTPVAEWRGQPPRCRHRTPPRALGTRKP
ncbi:hypothetical protein ABT297_36055 [Dactylosporangium sp. NPDC000555]|uniref:hypothetical protein n=1 Tax=Dactylosporangium sp. NPDC000555 TaxID=3154260 RepID=UPI0033288FD7